MMSFSLKQAFSTSALNFISTHFRFTDAKLARLSLAVLFGINPLHQLFAQKVGDVYSVADVKEIIYGKQKNVAILPYRQLQLSKKSTTGNPIYVTTDRIVTAKADGTSGYSLEGNGTEPGNSTLYRISEKFSRVWAFKNVRTLSQLPQLNISARAQQARKKGSEFFFAKGFNLILITERIDAAGHVTGYNEYYAKTDGEGGKLNVVKIDGDEVEPTHIADKYIALPSLTSLIPQKQL